MKPTELQNLRGGQTLQKLTSYARKTELNIQ